VTLSSQSIEADVNPYQVAGVAGFTVWYQDPQNWLSVFLYGGRCTLEVIDGAQTFGCVEAPFYVAQATPHHLSVDVDAASGQLTVSLDSQYVTTYQASTTNRSGLTGFYAGNSGASFDSFALTSNSATPVPEPSSVFLLGVGTASCCIRRLAQRRSGR
jgi:hypothetical protein